MNSISLTCLFGMKIEGKKQVARDRRLLATKNTKRHKTIAGQLPTARTLPSQNLHPDPEHVLGVSSRIGEKNHFLAIELAVSFLSSFRMCTVSRFSNFAQ
jgi:hypothetical protein